MSDELPIPYTIADVLGCVGADLLDVAQRIGELSPEVQAAATAVEVATITTSGDALSVEVARLLALVVESVAGDR